MKKPLFLDLPSAREAAKRPEVKRLREGGEISPRLKAFAEGKTFYIRTYGCQANIRDEETMAGYLSAAGFRRTEDPREADIAIINTCAVRENAEEKIYGEIGSFKANKEANPSFMLVLAGCVMGEEGIAKSLLDVYPFISLIIGTHEVYRLLPLLEEAITKKAAIVSSSSFSSEVVEEMPSLRLSSFEAYVNISYGCDKFCTYCIVPYTRGRERSRKMEDVLAECRALVAEGYKQITLLGQNVNSYGLDLHDGSNFATLLDEVAKTGIPRLRFLSSYPSQFTDAMIETMAKHPNIDPWLHFPVQSGSSSCLRRMGRRYTREEYLDIVSRIKRAIPNIALTTDIIVGFPGESDEEFEDTLSLCREVGFESAYTFIYSPREGTPAAKMEQLPSELVHQRFDRLKALVDELTAASSSAYVGKTVDVLVSGPSKKNPEKLSGYDRRGKLIHFMGPAYLKGAIVPVKIESSRVYSLQGSLVEDPLVSKARDLAYLMSLEPTLASFKSIEDEILHHPEFEEAGKRLKSLQKAFVSKKEKGDPSFVTAQEQFEDALKRILDDPTLANYRAKKEDADATLLTIAEKLK